MAKALATGLDHPNEAFPDVHAAQAAIHDLKEVASVTQLGVRLRVLIPDRHREPVALVERALVEQGMTASVGITAATLEDVFVAVTLRHPETVT